MRRLLGTLIVMFGSLLWGCGGHAWSTAGAPPAANQLPGTAPQGANPSYSAGQYDVHVVIEDSVAVALALTPHGAPAPAGIVTRPLPGAIVQYPDGSWEIADASGTFTPALSRYGIANAALFERDAEAAPYVFVLDPAGRTPALVAQVDAASHTTVDGNDRLTENAYAHILDGADLAALAAVTVHPLGQNALDGRAVPIEVVGLDSDGHVASFLHANVLWSRPRAGRIVPLGDGSHALYLAPNHGSGIDRFTASVSLPSGGQAFTASGAVAYADPASLVTVPGSLRDGTGRKLSVAAIAFLQRESIPFTFHQYSWFATPTGNGAFSARLPRNVRLSPQAQIDSTRRFVAARGPDGMPVVTADGSLLRLTVVDGESRFKDQDAGLPPVASYIHDAWYAATIAREQRIFDVNSGLQRLLGSAASPTSGTIASGLFKNWRFSWSGAGSNQTLTIVEAGANGNPGRQSATVAAETGGTYRFALYFSREVLSLAQPLVAAQSGSVLQNDGTWVQTSSVDGRFQAQVQERWYSTLRQTFGAPLYSDTLTYRQDSNGNVSIVDASMIDLEGRNLWQMTATRTPFVAANAGSANSVFSYAASVTRFYYGSRGTTQKTFALSGFAAGDGSGKVRYREPIEGVTVSYDVPDSTARGDRASGGVIDDATYGQLATFSVDSTDVVDCLVGEDRAHGYEGGQLTFSL